MEERIISIIGTAFNKDLSGVGIRDCIPSMIEGWDSLSFLNLILLLEEEFSISFELEDIEQMTGGGEDLLSTVVRVAGV